MAENNAGPEPIKPTPQEQIPPAAEGQEPEEALSVLPAILVEVQQRLESVFPELEFKALDDSLEVTVPADQLLDVASVAKNDLEYRMLMSVTGVDWKDSFEMLYHIYRLDSPFPLVLRCRLPHEEHPEIPSLMPLWSGADFQEREVYDLMGIVFVGHPDLRRILLADDFPGHPLRKDWQPDPDYVLVPHLRIPGYSGAKRGETSTGRFLDE
jgi:NADH-quinone oxidoreductase subunit C